MWHVRRGNWCRLVLIVYSISLLCEVEYCLRKVHKDELEMARHEKSTVWSKAHDSWIYHELTLWDSCYINQLITHHVKDHIQQFTISFPFLLHPSFWNSPYNWCERAHTDFSVAEICMWHIKVMDFSWITYASTVMFCINSKWFHIA